MKNDYPYDRLHIVSRIMAGLGIVGAVAAVLLRVWQMSTPIRVGSDAPAWTVIGVLLFLLLLLGSLVFIIRGGPRREITGKSSLVLSVAMLVAGGVMLFYGVVEGLARLGVVTLDAVPMTVVNDETPLLLVLLPWLQTVFCALGGLMMGLAGLRLASEGGTRRGIVQAGLLVPVLWSWLVLANYMMTYASMVRVTNGFFVLAMYVMELLFLFRFACYMAGIGKNGIGWMLFCSAGAVIFVLSAPLVSWVMYLLQDGDAIVAAGSAGLLDLMVGLLALTVSITLCQNSSAPVEEQSSEEDAPEWEGDAEESEESLLIDEQEDDAE